MLSWAARFNICCFLDNHSYQLPSHSLECLLAAGALRSIRASAGDAFDRLKDFTTGQPDWLFGHFGYGLAKETEPSDPRDISRQSIDRPDGEAHPGSVPFQSIDRRDGEAHSVLATLRSADRSPDRIGFPDLFFFVPEILIELTTESIRIGSCRDDHAAILEQINGTILSPVSSQPHSSDIPNPAVVAPGYHPSYGSEPDAGHQPPGQGFSVPDSGPSGYPDPTAREPFPHASGDKAPAPLVLQSGFTREEYLATVQALRRHILRGDCYEINFCQEFFAYPASIDPLTTWWSLSQASPNPFAAFYKLEDSYLLCASPERYLKRLGDTLISQPIKGTSPRNQGSEAQDKADRDELYNSSKDRSENVMVVDLVRNDLSKICLPGSVRVEELYGIYSFPQVHQMISTIKGELPPGTHWIEAVRATFPMGSMTGAPKKRVVELIGQYERTFRGIFSGAVGYVTPDGDFDFNVVIRSILYNQQEHYLSYQVGSGITFYSDAEKEYEECLWKAEGIKKAFEHFS